MTQAKHTPGPWNIYFNSQDNLVIRKMFKDCTESHVIAICHSGFENARLIAAAPDLLDSHEPEREGADFLDWIADRLVNVYGESENVDFVICLRRRAAKARAAIAKATGS